MLLDAFTSKKFEVPSAATLTVLGESVKVQAYGDGWLMENTALAPFGSDTVIVGDCGPSVFAGTEYCTVPLPVPEAPDVMEASDVSLDFAVHAQVEDEAVTAKEPVPPPTPTSAVLGLTL